MRARRVARSVDGPSLRQQPMIVPQGDLGQLHLPLVGDPGVAHSRFIIRGGGAVKHCVLHRFAERVNGIPYNKIKIL